MTDLAEMSGVRRAGAESKMMPSACVSHELPACSGRSEWAASSRSAVPTKRKPALLHHASVNAFALLHCRLDVTTRCWRRT